MDMVRRRDNLLHHERLRFAPFEFHLTKPNKTRQKALRLFTVTKPDATSQRQQPVIDISGMVPDAERLISETLNPRA